MLPLTVLLAAPSAHAYTLHTYGIVVRAYCDPGPTPCGHASQDDLRQYYQEQMWGLNEAWKPHNVSFKLLDVIVTSDLYYSAIEGTPDIDVPGTDEGDKVRALHDLAAQTPDVITLFVLPRIDLCWSVVAPHQFPDYPSVFHGFFCGTWGDGQVLAHELGHHFCLPHPFTFDDPADQSSPSWDGDGIGDTPPDPGPKENDGTVAGADVNASGVERDGHVFCEQGPTTQADANSPNATACDVDCWAVSGGARTPASFAPDANLLMGYYGDCQGPYVINGQRTIGFSGWQEAAVERCIDTFAPRVGLTDLCATRGHDTDHDGICDHDDACPWENALDPDPAFDPDGDGAKGSCDNCWQDPNPDQADTDGDGIGDACDLDADNDGCVDTVDLRPDDAMMRVGRSLRPGCDDSVGDVMGFEGWDHDGDGTLDCAETDDDGDGVPDDQDPCPWDPSVGIGGDDFACTRLDDPCALLQADFCGPGCGILHRIDLVSRIDPADRLRFDDIQVVGNTIYLGRTLGMSGIEVARAMRGEAFGWEGDAGTLALELTDVAGRAAPRVLAEWVPSQATLVGALDGTTVAVEVSGSSVTVETAWGVGLSGADLAGDADGDGVPDPADDCVAVAQTRQVDSDRDGFGDACDPDLDQDGLVDADDLAILESCVGARPTLRARYTEDTLRTLLPDVDREAMALARRCWAADLDGDGVVTDDDVAIGHAFEGHAPGPSGTTASAEPEPGHTGDTGLPGHTADTGDTESPPTDGGTTDDDGKKGCHCDQSSGAGAGWLGALGVMVGLRLRRRR